MTIWQGRAKLYAMAGDPPNRAWQERGTGNFRFNMTLDGEPRKARFVLRADGTHRLLLNAAVTKSMVFGGNAQGDKPKDTRLLFNSPTTEGELEMYLLKVCYVCVCVWRCGIGERGNAKGKGCMANEMYS